MTEGSPSPPSEPNARLSPSVLRVVVAFALFGVLALPLLRLPGAESPALLARADHGAVSIAIVGDSRPHVTLSPARLREGLAAAGLRGDGYNFAVDGTDLVHHTDFVLRGLLARGTKPKVIIWAPNPLGFNDARTNNRLEQLAGMELGVLRSAGAPFEMQLDLVTMRIFPPYRQRPLVAAKVADYAERAGKKGLKLQERLGLTWVEPALSREYLPQPDGHEPFKVLDWRDRFERGLRSYETEFAALTAMRWHLQLAHELLRRAHAAGVLVVVIQLPVAHVYLETFTRDARYIAWRGAIEQMAKAEGAVYLDHERHFPEPDEQRFGDPAHMNVDAAYEYSAWLGTELARDPAVRAALSL